MASTTPNIGLTLPTGAEKISRQIINDNNTIIDGKMGAVLGWQNLQGEIDALNSKIAVNTDSGTFGSKSALDSILNNVLNGMESDGRKSIKVVCNSGFDIFPNGATFDCVINKFGSSSSYGTIFMQQVGSSKTIVGNKNNGTWSYEQLALNSKTKSLTGTTNNTGALSTGLSIYNVILGVSMNSNINLEISGWTAYGGAWFLNSTPNTAVDVTIYYREA